jgi:hypothetical protein
MELPKYESIDVTLETEVPALPAKEDILKQPSKDVFDEQMAALDNQIKHLREQKEDLFNKKRETIEGGKIQGSNMTFKEGLTAKINESKEINKKKRAC